MYLKPLGQVFWQCRTQSCGQTVQVFNTGIFWNILEYFGIFWNILEYFGINWNKLECFGIYWNILNILE